MLLILDRMLEDTVSRSLEDKVYCVYEYAVDVLKFENPPLALIHYYLNPYDFWRNYVRSTVHGQSNSLRKRPDRLRNGLDSHEEHR